MGQVQHRLCILVFLAAVNPAIYFFYIPPFEFFLDLL